MTRKQAKKRKGAIRASRAHAAALAHATRLTPPCAGYSHKARVGAVARERNSQPKAAAVFQQAMSAGALRAPALAATSATMAQCAGGYAGVSPPFARGGEGDSAASDGAILGELAALHERVDGVQETLGRMDEGIESMREQMGRVERTLSALASAGGVPHLRRR